MPVPTEWIEHRRGDGEVLGWMRQDGNGFVVVDLLGRPQTTSVDWLTAEESLEAIGIGYLADAYELLLDDGRWLRVRITEVSSETITVKRDDWGAIDIPQVEYTLPFPVPAELRPFDSTSEKTGGERASRRF